MGGIFNDGFRKVRDNLLPSLALGDVTPVLLRRRIAESVSHLNMIHLGYSRAKRAS